MRLYLTKDNMNNDIPFKIFKRCGEAYAESVHSHEYIQMGYVLSGSCHHVLSDSSSDYGRFGLFIVPPYTPHAITLITPDTELIVCEFSERFINETLSSSSRDTIFDYAYIEPFFLYEGIKSRIGRDRQIVVERLFLEMLEYFKHPDKYSLLFIKANLLKLLAIIASEYDRDLESDNLRLIDRYRGEVEKTLEYLGGHLSEKLYLEDMCKRAHMSHTTFSYVFKQMTGKTFSEYLMNVRISHACELLETTELSITDICDECGFGDSAYFSRAFKKLIGVPPMLYRRQSKLRK